MWRGSPDAREGAKTSAKQNGAQEVSLFLRHIHSSKAKRGDENTGPLDDGTLKFFLDEVELAV